MNWIERMAHDDIDREADARLAEFKKNHPRYFDKDEQDYPEDLSDIQPFSRLCSYPWGG